MKLKNPTVRPLVAIAGAVVLAACASMSSAQPAKVSDGVLVGPTGMTLYTFDKDTAGNGKSVCNGQCATNWPPLMAKDGDAAKDDWSIVTRDDGGKQWAYKGKPIYLYTPDKKAGDATGDNFRDVWHVIK